MNVILVGMPASGKTTVANVLSQALGEKVIDTDALIVERHGVISEIFEKFGEEYFRDLESLAVKEAAENQNAVISTGGGCILRKENVQTLKRSGKIIYLRTSLKELLKRTVGDVTRPLLQGEREDKIKRLLSVRSHLYEEAADLIIDTDGLTPEEIANKITEFIK